MLSLEVFYGVLRFFLEVFSGGSVLWPLLFLVYINDIPSCVEHNVTIPLFADECVVCATVWFLDDQIKLINSLNSIANWSERWGMKFNIN